MGFVKVCHAPEKKGRRMLLYGRGRRQRGKKDERKTFCSVVAYYLLNNCEKLEIF